MATNILLLPQVSITGKQFVPLSIERELLTEKSTVSSAAGTKVVPQPEIEDCVLHKSKNQPQMYSLDRLPDSLIDNILELLPIMDLTRVSRVSKNIRALAQKQPKHVVQFYVHEYYAYNALVTNDGNVYIWREISPHVFCPRTIQIPSVVDDFKDITVEKIACNSHCIFALTKDGNIYKWDIMRHFHLPIDLDRAMPQMFDPFKDIHVKQVSIQETFYVALTQDGKVYTWGDGSKGQLGHGNKESQDLPKIVEALEDVEVVQVLTSRFHVAALTKDGKVYTWGDGRTGGLGNSYSTLSKYELSPVMVESLKNINVVHISFGQGHIFSDGHIAVLADNGDVYHWGPVKNRKGANLPPVVFALKPEKLQLERKAIRIKAGKHSRTHITLENGETVHAILNYDGFYEHFDLFKNSIVILAVIIHVIRLIYQYSRQPSF